MSDSQALFQSLLDKLSPEELAHLRDQADETLERRGGPLPTTPSAGGPPRKARACRLFSVPRDVKYLESAQLDRLHEAFRQWVDEAASARSRLPRERVRILYLLLRYSGARLGEILALDDVHDIDPQRQTLRLAQNSGGGAGSHEGREVVLPESVMVEVAGFLSHPGLAGSRGSVFHLDQGFVRRKFSEQAERSGLPRELLNPRVVRHSRAVELLRAGVPMPVVQAMLGHSSASLTASYCEYTDADLMRILHTYLAREKQMKTSARNTFVGTVTAIRKGQILAEVELETAGGLHIVSVITNESMENLGIVEGLTVNASVKAPWVVLVKEPELAKTSARNRFPGVIERINVGGISAEVVATLPEGTTMCALITDESVAFLDLKVGDTVWFLFKAFSVILNLD